MSPDVVFLLLFALLLCGLICMLCVGLFSPFYLGGHG